MDVNENINEIEFYKQKLKESKAKLYESEWKDKSIKILDQKIEENWSMYHADNVDALKKIKSNSIHYTLTSVPFSSFFTYSASIRDMGNSTDQEFYNHFNFFVPELYRCMMPGRLVSLHLMNLPMTITSDGVMGIKDFRGNMIKVFENYGFIFHSEVCIWKDPLVQATRTKTLSLAHKQISKDSSRCGQGFPDYIVTMRKPGVNPERISHGRGFECYVGDREEPKAEKNDAANKNKYSHYVWQRYASPVWFDINQTRTLNVRLARENNDERHVCPMQLDTVARCLHLWTNKGDIILDPFTGIGSTGDGALRTGRKFIGVELKKSYYDISCKNLKQACGNRLKGFF